MSEYTPTIGLEIHAELKTQTKMFCRSKNDPDEVRPNVNICPVCLAHPGTLPVINREAVHKVLTVGAALDSRLADYSEFDRKNYFYPDLPKGYQLSQYAYPLVEGGELLGVELTRIHLEEDTASSVHDEDTGTTVIDYNRAGVPLMELVTEPVIHSAEQAGKFARELQLLLRYLGASEANMEKGEMRVEANVSLTRIGDAGLNGSVGRTRLHDKRVLGTKVEIKNLNSFNAMERAIRYEVERQSGLLESGRVVRQETRGWDENKQATFAQRTKEGSADYRYFPDPDLPSLRFSELDGCNAASLRSALPELPAQKRERYTALGVKGEDAELYVRDRRFGEFFDAVCKEYAAASVQLANNYIANDLVKIIRDIEERDSKILTTLPVSAVNFRVLIDMIAARELSSRAGKDVLRALVLEGVRPREYAEKHNLLQKGDSSALESVVDDVLSKNLGVVADYKAGKAPALEFLLGQCMRALKGAGDPAILREILKRKMA